MTTSGTIKSPSSSVISTTTIDTLSKINAENNLLWNKKKTNQPTPYILFHEGEQGTGTGAEEEYDSDNSPSKEDVNYHHHFNNMNNLRRPRAETMPTQSTSFPYINDSPPLVIDSSNSNYNNIMYDNSHQPHQLHHNNWINDVLLTSPTTPTTDQLLKGDDNNTIASTFASLGLDDSSSFSASSSARRIHTSHSYSSLKTLSENQQQQQEVYNRSVGTEDLRSSIMNLRQQQQQQQNNNRPRALSSVIEKDNNNLYNQQQQQQRSIWATTTTNNKPFLRTSNSSADLLEMIARQRKVTTGNNSPTTTASISHYYQQDDTGMMMENNSSGVWTTGESTTASSSPFVDQHLSYMMDYPNTIETESVISSSTTTNSSNHQIPSRSLWIGQLDLNLYGANELGMIFGKFGVIESIRILPDRECAFINYSTVEEAQRAKEILVNKMSSRLSNHHPPVKVGFGKLDTSTSTTTTTNTTMMPPPSPQATTNEVGPTRALWVGNIPTNTTQQALASIFSQFGMIESIRVLSHKNCGFINYYTQEEAMRAKRSCHNKEIMGPGTGTVRIGFAKVPPMAAPPSLLSEGGGLVVAQQQQQQQQQIFNNLMDENHNKTTPFTPTPTSSGNSAMMMQAMMDDHQLQQQMFYMMEMMNTSGGSSPSPNLMNSTTNNMYSAVANERKLIMQEFGQDDSDGPIFDVLHLPTSYYHSIPAAPELGQSRKVDISRLRDIRKRLDTGHITTKELEVIAVECVDELVELCSDYIGNTVIQRLFERCSEMTKSMMLEAVAPFLASIGVHKNGTWAAQKIIDTAKLPTQISIVCGHIQPYVPSLLLDQFGNYVVQCCLGLGPTRNQFIFDSIVDSCWEIAQGRFGARAVRATLESPHVTKRQQKYVAASLVQHALLLATNANGALLLIWLLDTSGIPGRYRVLAPRLLPHLARLCTHKLASLTVLKLINQRQEPDARSLILESLFFSSTTTVIDEILHDQVHGVSLVQKILSSSYIELRERQRIAERVKQLLQKLKLQHVQGYKRLMEEINMVMVDSAPGASLGVPPPTNHPFTISPSLAAALHAKYMNPAASLVVEENGAIGGVYSTTDEQQQQQAAAMMANFYAAAAATNSIPPIHQQQMASVMNHYQHVEQNQQQQEEEQ